MAKVRSGPDTPAPAVRQDGETASFLPWSFASGRGRLRPDTLIALRWRGVVGQIVVISLALLGLDLQFRWQTCYALVAISAALNLVLMRMNRRGRRQADWENAGVLAFDTLEITALLLLTGGVTNPFSILLLAPIALAAAVSRGAYVIGMVVLGVACVLGLAYFAAPLPSPLAEAVQLPPVLRVGMTASLICAIGFVTSYVWRASRESERMEIALNVAQQVLAREQKLSALGALAAAAAHELGTPLATIQIVSKELARSTAGALKEDAELLVEQASRCREILKRLTETPETTDAMHERLTLADFLNEVIEPHLGGEVRIEAVLSGPPGAAAPEIRRIPEMLHAMTTLVENATDFAKLEVLVRARYDTHQVTLEIQDDGPGFAPDVIHRLGQPYVTTRPQGEESRSGHHGMGLGFFIAKTLLEKSGAVVNFENSKRGGAIVSARWSREIIEAPALRDYSSLGA